MTNQRVTDLTTVNTAADADVLYLVDVSDTTDDPAGSARQITASDLLNEQRMYNAVSYGADPTGLSDSTTAIQAAIDAAATATALDSGVPAYTWITEVEGGTVYFPRGWYRIDSTITLKNRVSLRGESFTSACIVAGSSFTDAVMIDCVDSTNPIFDSRIEHIRIHANNEASITSVIHAQAWQEHCGLFHASIDGYQGEGILIEDVSSGSAGFEIANCTFGGFSGNNAAIHIESTVPNAFQMQVNQVTINSSGVATNGIHQENGRGHYQNVHIESATNGIHLEGGTALMENITGAGTVVNLVTLHASYNSRARAFMLDINGGSGNTWNDLTATDIDYTGFKAFVAFGAD
jgi:hypothetical protein